MSLKKPLKNSEVSARKVLYVLCTSRPNCELLPVHSTLWGPKGGRAEDHNGSEYVALAHKFNCPTTDLVTVDGQEEGETVAEELRLLQCKQQESLHNEKNGRAHRMMYQKNFRAYDVHIDDEHTNDAH